MKKKNWSLKRYLLEFLLNFVLTMCIVIPEIFYLGFRFRGYWDNRKVRVSLNLEKQNKKSNYRESTKITEI